MNPVFIIAAWALMLAAVVTLLTWFDRRDRHRFLTLMKMQRTRYLPRHWADSISDPNRRLQGSCSLCGQSWTYRHPSQSRAARVYHNEFVCTFERKAA